MALAAALLGWMFDGFEMGLFPLIGSPALQDLLHVKPGSTEVSNWFAVIIAVFLVGAATGGVLFGWLGDRIGRVRAMSLSIATYAIFTGLCGFSTEAWHIALFRFIASLGMGGEWSLGVALVNEVWSDGSRAKIAGLVGAASNVGFLMVGVLSLVLGQVIGGVKSFMLGIGLPDAWVQSLLANSAWRFLMISGALPALLTFFIQIFVPESKKWQHEKDQGRTSHWVTQDLLGVFVGCIAALVVIYMWSPIGTSKPVATIGTFIGVGIALYGYLQPVKRYMKRAQAVGAIAPGQEKIIVKRMLLGAGLAAVALLGTWGSLQWAVKWASELAPNPALHAKEYTQIWLALGAIVATLVAPLAGDIIGRRMTYTLLCLGSIVTALLFYNVNTSYTTTFLVTVFLAGGVTAAFYGWFPLYFPELFPTSVRATGQGFAFNFGRILAAIGGLQTANLQALFHNSFPKAGSVMTVIYLIGVVIVWFGPETKGKPLPD